MPTLTPLVRPPATDSPIPVQRAGEVASGYDLDSILDPRDQERTPGEPRTDQDVGGILGLRGLAELKERIVPPARHPPAGVERACMSTPAGHLLRGLAQTTDALRPSCQKMLFTPAKASGARAITPDIASGIDRARALFPPRRVPLTPAERCVTRALDAERGSLRG